MKALVLSVALLLAGCSSRWVTEIQKENMEALGYKVLLATQWYSVVEDTMGNRFVATHRHSTSADELIHIQPFCKEKK